MKLLAWMHRKLGQNNTNNEMLPPGQAMFNSQHLHSKANHSGGTFAQPPKESHLRKSFASMESVDLDRDRGGFSTEPFHGFLAIGTLGTETRFMSEPETPTFSISVDNIAERESEVTESELKLINDELEKVLGAESAKEDSSVTGGSSGRNSHISTGRSSHASRPSSTAAAAVAAKSMEMMMLESSSGIGKTVCPLQGYLFGSAVELPLPERVMVEKKENRTSLGELFQRQKAEEGWGSSRSERGGGEKRRDKETAINLMLKKMLKRKMVDAASSRNNNNPAAAATADSTSAETKLHKVLHMFQKKVHPETSTCMPRLNSTQYGCRIKHGGSDEDFSSAALPEKRYKLRQYERNPSISFGDGGNREFWIKSDADYLVLEL